MSEVNLVGLISNIENENRALANIQVLHNGNVYDWQVFIPNDVTNLSDYIQQISPNIIEDINTKEQLWSDLDPKTRTIIDPTTGQSTEIEILKSEIVKPNIPDYYALRRQEYPSLGDQLDAIWKGIDSQSYLDMKSRIAEIKSKYPKT